LISEEDLKRLEDEVRPLRPKKAALAEETKELSPRLASIQAEGENMTSVLEANRLKNEKDRAKLTELRKEIEEEDIDKAGIDSLREKVTLIEGKCEVKKKELEKLKEQYSEAVSTNHRQDAI
jgi:chromosome segregation ATPase